MLAKRLIYGLSQSMDAEEAMINRLKVLLAANVSSANVYLTPHWLNVLQFCCHCV